MTEGARSGTHPKAPRNPHARKPPSARSTCRSCNAEIIWTVTRNGKRMPVDFEPTPTGDFVLDKESDGSFTSNRYSHFVHDESRPRRKSHFETCPNAKQHRKEKR